MKHLFILTFSIFQLSILFSQKNFIISGSTNFISNGKVTLRPNAPIEFYSIKIKSDTVNVINHFFSFEGSLNYPQQFRISIITKDKKYLTEPFFMDTGFQRIEIDSSGHINDFLDFGYGVSMEGSEANYEYTNRYLPQLNDVHNRINAFLLQIDSCDAIKDIEAKKACVIKSEIDRYNLRKSRDSLLNNYATIYPRSPIIVWLLYGLILKYGYNDYYQNTLDKLSIYKLPGPTKSIEFFLYKQKVKAIGSVFPLADFINERLSNNYIQNNKYTLIDFWYSGCSPCIRQFKSLSSIYEKNKQKGFDVVAISIDGKDNIQIYREVLNKFNYPWKQILDTGGVRTNSIDVNQFPTNFLLDDKRRIISINIKMEVLEDFLEKKL